MIFLGENDLGKKKKITYEKNYNYSRGDGIFICGELKGRGLTEVIHTLVIKKLFHAYCSAWHIFHTLAHILINHPGRWVCLWALHRTKAQF